MAKYMAYFSKEVYGYKEFEAKNNTEMIDKLEEFEAHGNFDKDLDHIKDNGWIFEEYEEEQKKVI